MDVNENLAKKTIEVYGWDNERLVVVEELSELTKEVTKLGRNLGNLVDLVEEMADVYIVLKMLEIQYDITPEAVEAMIKKKETRNARRIGYGL